MDYEKKYKEAVNKIKNLLDDGEKNGFTIVTYKTDLESIFPELKESEDERIRKVLIELSKEVAQEQFFINRGTNLQNVIAWLEKQGEKKPAWSEKDEIALGDALWCCKQAASIAKDENDMGNIWYVENWLKSLKDRYTWKPSEEQINTLSKYAEQNNKDGSILTSLYQDLKNLRGK